MIFSDETVAVISKVKGSSGWTLLAIVTVSVNSAQGLPTSKSNSKSASNCTTKVVDSPAAREVTAGCDAMLNPLVPVSVTPLLKSSVLAPEFKMVKVLVVDSPKKTASIFLLTVSSTITWEPSKTSIVAGTSTSASSRIASAKTYPACAITFPCTLLSVRVTESVPPSSTL